MDRMVDNEMIGLYRFTGSGAADEEILTSTANNPKASVVVTHDQCNGTQAENETAHNWEAYKSMSYKDFFDDGTMTFFWFVVVHIMLVFLLGFCK